MVRRLLLTLIALAVAAVLLLSSWPQLLGWQRSFPWAELTAMRGLIAAVAIVAVVFLIIAAVVSRPLRAVAILLAVVFVAIVALNGFVLSIRGFASDSWAKPVTGEVTVLTLNTLGGAARAAAISRLALDEGADVLALPETTRDDAEAIAEILASDGRPMQLFVVADGTSAQQSTALLISEELGPYAVDRQVGSTPRLPSIVARPVEGDGPTIVAAHVFPPLPDGMADWEAGLSWLAELCRGPNTIVAGDLNATLDHFAGLADGTAHLGACMDASRTTGTGATGTWPRTLPALLGAPIDHVLATSEWVAVNALITDVPGSESDHRPLLARLLPAA